MTDIPAINPRMLYLREIIRRRNFRGVERVLMLARVAVADGADIEEMIASALATTSYRTFERYWLSRCREK